MNGVPELRVRAVNDANPVADGEFVLYWMIAQRRTGWNFALDQAIAWARDLKKPLLIFEPLRCDYRWASDRLHRFVLQGMAANAAALESRSTVRYYPYVEPRRGADHGLLEALARRACLVVTDDFPTYFLPRMVELVGRRLVVRLEAVDSNGLLPLRCTDKVFGRAYDFRRFVQNELLNHLEMPAEDPTQHSGLPRFDVDLSEIERRWPAALPEMLEAGPSALAELPIDHGVTPAAFDGGQQRAGERLAEFLRWRLPKYGEQRNEPSSDAASGFSPYLHFGHLSPFQIFAELVQRENWSPDCVAKKANGAREGWWGMSPTVESFLDELITWREVGYHFADRRPDYARYSSLPAWAQQTLEEHSQDDRPDLYTLDEFETAATHDELWNAAQRQLVTEGRMHNYLRMLWGKKILQWSESPREALRIMIHLNNKYAVDGRNPNSYSGIFWCLGRFDRAWGPERPVFGKIRYMSSENTARKLDVKGYLARYAADDKRVGELF